MSVDGNFVVLIHKQLLCLVLNRGGLVCERGRGTQQAKRRNRGDCSPGSEEVMVLENCRKGQKLASGVAGGLSRDASADGCRRSVS